jgi:catechol 2,3-dioxygenase-like lactoylglutathione lyase family enzyme
MTTQRIHKATPVLFVESIEACLPLWQDRLGFERVMDIPEGEHLGFVLLVRDGVEIMLQSRASLAADLPAIAAAFHDAASFVFIEVADIADLVARVGDTAVASPLRDTFYGSRELTIRTPGGHFVTFAQMDVVAA